ncbi:hypothetical protein EXIGLDRAFT_695791 [Exidia glandulosa HHB12029]|uniref:receptor protein-tyrosine kinase n=1 Tax=Exidia glandulosa HHB12029 TaxID=1314781 RepID=A0A165FLA1_EXIGL|nr:hypothetical protein EXIGLDRAFT_695791 [Exidia glandulosa HHB12029]
MHVVVIVALVAFARALLVPTAASATSTVLVVHFRNGSVFSATLDAVQTGTASASGSTRAVGPTPFITSPSTALPTHPPKQPTVNSVASVQSAVPTVHQSSSSAHRLTVTSGAASVQASTAVTPGGNVLSFVDAGSVTVAAENTRSTTTSAAAISGGSRDHLTLVLIIIAAFLGVLLLVVLVAVGGFVYRRRRRLQQHRAARPYTSAWTSDVSAWTSDVSRSQHGLKLDARRLTTEGSEKSSTRTAYDPPSERCKEDTASCLTLQLKYPGFAID